MRHSNSGGKFSRSPAHRKALFMNLAKALLQHGRIVTTEAKAKDLRGIIEPLITLAKRNDLHSRRLAYKHLNDHKIVKYLFDEIGPLFMETPGGYTRVLKLAKHRKGDNAPMAIIEFTRKKGEAPEATPEKKRHEMSAPATPAGDAKPAEPQTSTEAKAEAAAPAPEAAQPTQAESPGQETTKA
ncbi:MAG: 50S ribosomal protein L17 [Desulfovibrio sp.]|nr:50S ribosomal protein L17 [Desulfovibrio sp.]